MVGEDSDISRTATPAPPKETNDVAEASAAPSVSADNGRPEMEKGNEQEEARDEAKNPQPVELPAETRLKLRRLEKLEPKYTGGSLDALRTRLAQV